MVRTVALGSKFYWLAPNKENTVKSKLMLSPADLNLPLF